METETREITEKELNEIVGNIVADETKALEERIEALRKEIMLSKKSEDERDAEISKKFISDLALRGEVGEKAVSSQPSSFGYTVPTTLAKKVLEKRDKISKIRKYAYSFEMSGPFRIPTEGTGVTAYHVGENEEITESNPTISKKDLNDYYIGARVLIPYQLLDTSAINVENYVSNLCSRALANLEETDFVAGDGNSKPTGFRQETVETIGMAGDSLSYADLVELFYSLEEQYRQNAVFITSTRGLVLIKEILDNSGRPIFDVRDQTVFGKPLIECVDIPENLGTSGNETEIWFADLSYYWIKDGVKMVADRDKIISSMQVELVFHQAVDGCVVLPGAFKKLSGVK